MSGLRCLLARSNLKLEQTITSYFPTLLVKPTNTLEIWIDILKIDLEEMSEVLRDSEQSEGDSQLSI